MRCQLKPVHCFQITQEFLDYPWEGKVFRIENNEIYEYKYPYNRGTVGDWLIFYSWDVWGITKNWSFETSYILLED